MGNFFINYLDEIKFTKYISKDDSPNIGNGTLAYLA